MKEHLKTDANLDGIVEAMTLAGLEVENVENPAQRLKDFSIAKIKSCEKHPDANRLSVCQVETKDGLKQIVCGAPNVRADMTVAYAPLGTYIPGLDYALDKKPRKIRGQESHGMMCSNKELEMGADHEGIMDLDRSLKIGTPLSDALDLNDPVIDFEVTPNRPDWLGVNNIARDLAATGIGQWSPPIVKPVKGTFPCPVRIKVDARAGCPVFAGRVVRGVRNGPSPDWLQKRLKAISLRPISALVDITNLVTYDRARPLHVYDLAKLTGTVRTRLGKGEMFKALDGKNYTCSGEMCVIADDVRVLGLGGVIGGTYSGVSEDTTDILIECAYFDPMRTRRTGRMLAINSDAQYRFERGVDTGFVESGLELATQLVLDLCGGNPSEVRIAGNIPAPPAPIDFDPALTRRLTGLCLSNQKITGILTSLGFGIEETKNGWRVTVPSHRRDCSQGADLVEEIARIYGLHNMEPKRLTVPPGHRKPLATILQNRVRMARRALAGRGLSEAVTWSFCAHGQARLFDGGSQELLLDNPISGDLDCMRPSVLIHLLLAGQRNADQGYPGAALFEAGPTYQTSAPDGQTTSIGGMRRIETRRDWQGNQTPDAFTSKTDTIAALSAMGVKVETLQIGRPTGSYWHPGRSGRLQMGPKNVLADFGEIHPETMKELGIEGRVCAFEIRPASVPAGRKKSAKSKGALVISDLMPVHRNFAFVVEENVVVETLLRAVRGVDKALISNVSVFDLYHGKGVDKGQKSVALDVILSPKDRTLTDKDIEAVSGRIIAAAKKAGGTLRS